MLLDQLSSLRDDLAAVEPWTLTGSEVREVLVAVRQARTALDAVTSRLVATAAGMGLPKEDGKTSTTAWLADLTGISKPEGSRLSSLGEKLADRAHAVEAAWQAGRITTDQAAVILGALDKLPDWIDAEPLDVAQAHLLEQARTVNLDDLKREANRVLEVVDPDGADEELGRQLRAEEERARKRTRLSMSRQGDGTTTGAFRLSDHDADTLRAALEGIAAPRRWPLNARHLGLDPDDYNSLGRDEKLGHAFAELIAHLPTDALPQSGGLAATVTVNIHADDLRTGRGTATNSSGTVVSAARAQRTACNAGLVGIFLDAESKIIDLGQSRRLYDRNQRIALGVRDGGCVWEGCDRPPSWCEAHHLNFWSDDGPTDLANAALLCHFHHFLVHEGEWVATMADDGVVEVVPPKRVDPEQRPRRHQRFARRARAG